MKAQSRPAIILLHGWGLSADRFSPLADVLRREGWRVYAPDFPGFGASQMPDHPFTLSDYADFLDAYIRKHSLQAVVLVGHSFGGRVALKYSLLNTPYVRAMILTGTPGVTPVPKKKLLFFIFFAKMGKFIFSVWPLNFFQEKIRLWYYWLVGAREFYRAEGVMRDTFKRIVQEELLTAMSHVRIPCLLVWGERDRITPVWIAKKMHNIIKDSKLIIIPNRDHGVPFKDSKLFVSHIEPFLSKL